MRMQRLFPWALTLGIVLIACHLHAQTTKSRSQLRRTVDPSERSAFGTVTLTKRSNEQIFDVEVKGLGESSFGVWQGQESTFQTNFFDLTIAPLDRTNFKKGSWARTLEGVGAAPPEFVQIGFPDLDDLAGLRVDICKPGENRLIQGVTNVVGNVTNIITGILVPTANVTNGLFATLWAPLYPLTANPSAGSYVRKGILLPPGGLPPPSPGAAGKVLVRFKGSQGNSVFDVNAGNLTRGQVYHLFIADSTNLNTFVLIDAGTMTTSKSGSTARFVRDTRFGDPLPQQVRDAGDLSGRVVQIRDDFGFFIHLEGIIP